MHFRKILHSPTSTNHSLNARSPLGNDERSFAVRGRSSGSCNVGVWLLPERIQQLISTKSFRSHSNNEALL
jgi:hypothetical protein